MNTEVGLLEYPDLDCWNKMFGQFFIVLSAVCSHSLGFDIVH